MMNASQVKFIGTCSVQEVVAIIQHVTKQSRDDVIDGPSGPKWKPFTGDTREAVKELARGDAKRRRSSGAHVVDAALQQSRKRLRTVSGSLSADEDETLSIHQLQAGAEANLDVTHEPAQSSAPSHASPPPCLLYTSPSPRDKRQSRMPSSA